MSQEQTPKQKFEAAVASHGKYHSSDCEHAHESRCRCWCKGEYHGIKTGVYAKLNGNEIKHTIIEEAP